MLTQESAWWAAAQVWRTPEVLQEIDRFYFDDFFRFVRDYLNFGSGSYAGKKFQLAGFQVDQVFGPKLYTLRADGTRQYREVGQWRPRKNGKTEGEAAQAVWELAASRDSAEVICAAGNKEDASILYDTAQVMVESNPHLNQLIKVTESKKLMRNRKTGGTLRAIATNDRGKHGRNPSLVIGDEMHTWKHHDMWYALRTGSGTRPQALIESITTAGVSDSKELEFQMYKFAKRCESDPTLSPEYLPIIMESPDKADWQDEQVWRDCNPAIEAGFRDIGDMRRLAIEAKDNPALENVFRRLYLNQHTQQLERWISMEQWHACTITNEPVLSGRCKTYGGLDLASVQDVCAWCMTSKIGAGYRSRWKFFIPRESMFRVETLHRVPYSAWEEQGLVIACPGRTIDYDLVEDHVVRDCREYRCKEIGVDPWNAAQMCQNLERRGVTAVIVDQTYRSLSAPTQALGKAIVDGVYDHGGNAVAGWMAGNVSVSPDAHRNIKPLRPEHNASALKIDGIVAAVMSLAMILADSGSGSRISPFVA